MPRSSAPPTPPTTPPMVAMNEEELLELELELEELPVELEELDGELELELDAPRLSELELSRAAFDVIVAAGRLADAKF